MASHRGKKVGVWLSVLVVLVPLALQGAGVAWALRHLWGAPPLLDPGRPAAGRCPVPDRGGSVKNS